MGKHRKRKKVRRILKAFLSHDLAAARADERAQCANTCEQWAAYYQRRAKRWARKIGVTAREVLARAAACQFLAAILRSESGLKDQR